MIRDHWWREGTDADACGLTRCGGRPRAEHREACGEWLDPRHWHRPRLLRPLTCAKCGRTFGHSTHIGSSGHRRLWR